MAASLPDPENSVLAVSPEPLEIKLQRLRFCREEIRHEFNLLSNRVSAHITSQSFLVTGSALSMGNPEPEVGRPVPPGLSLALVLRGINCSILV